MIGPVEFAQAQRWAEELQIATIAGNLLAVDYAPGCLSLPTIERAVNDARILLAESRRQLAKQTRTSAHLGKSPMGIQVPRRRV